MHVDADAPGAQGLEHLAAGPIHGIEAQAQHVEVPGVLPIRRLVGRDQTRVVAEGLRVAGGDGPPAGEETVQPGELAQPQGALDVAEPVVEAETCIS